MHRLRLCLLVAYGLWAAAAHSQSYTFTTLAGSIDYGSTDGTGTNARFFNPSGVALDSAGNLYVADQFNHTIRKITPDKVVSTLAGRAGSYGSTDGTGSNARFNNLRGVALDSAGNLYVADQNNHTIRKVTPAGVVSTLAGLAGSSGSTDGSGSNARFNNPSGIALDSAGNLYVADQFNYAIRKITPDGVVSTLAGRAGYFGSTDGSGSNARFFNPSGVALDSAGNLYVADQFNHTIRKITPDGVVSTLAGRAGSYGSTEGTGSNARFNNPSGIALDSAGNLYVADQNNHTIRKVTPSGVVTTLAGRAGSFGSTDGTGSNARFESPRSVTVDSLGVVYVADYSNHTLRKITPSGEVSTLAGLATFVASADGTGSNARFNYPRAVAVDSAGNVLVADYGNHTIRKITPEGMVSTLAGSAGSYGNADGTGSSARFFSPCGVAVDKTGNVYVADSSNRTIRKITPAGVVSTLAGRAGSSGNTDGTGSNAQFYYPFGIAVDSAGNVFVSDQNNCNIRKITPAGVVSTLAGLAGSYGSTDGTGSNARFNSPSGIALDSAGNLYVADERNYTIRKITPAGVVSTLAGRAGYFGSADAAGSDARFLYPSGIAVDSANNVYVADSINRTVRKITPGGVVTTLAGLLGAAGSTDGPGSDARFYFPSGLAMDSADSLYVADSLNNTIRLGRIASGTPPSIRFGVSANHLLLSWPLTASNVVVEVSSTLSSAAVWTQLPNQASTSGDSYVMTNTLDGGARFYRLRKP